MEWLARTELLLGETALEKLSRARVAVFGLGGVGGYAAEALVRSGIGAIDLIDNDTVSLTNLNRQLFALHSTLGQYKTEAAKARFLDINPRLSVTVHTVFFMPDNSAAFDFSQYSYIVDAIDTVTGKIELAVQAQKTGTPLISSMGTGNKLDPCGIQITDLSKTTVCPLARVMRRELKKRGIMHLKVAYSPEEPHPPAGAAGQPAPGRRQVPGSTAFVPPAAGLAIASAVVQDLIQ